jgi:predicted MFS family arabinose efflux permease
MSLVTLSPAVWLWLLAVGVGLIVGVMAFSVASQRLEDERRRRERGSGAVCAGR